MLLPTDSTCGSLLRHALLEVCKLCSLQAALAVHHERVLFVFLRLLRSERCAAGRLNGLCVRVIETASSRETSLPAGTIAPCVQPATHLLLPRLVSEREMSEVAHRRSRLLLPVPAGHKRKELTASFLPRRALVG